MGRHAKSRIVIKNITDVARTLFLSMGYKATTTRQIIEKAGITTGTLYHFFKTKEDILLQIVKEAYFETMKVTDGILGTQGDSILHYAIIYVLEMKAVEKFPPVADLYLHSCSSWHITKAMLPLHIQRNIALFKDYNPDFTEQDYYLRTLALRGMELSFIIEQINAGKADYEAICSVFIPYGFSLFKVPPGVIDETVQSALDFIRHNTLIIQGFRI